MVGTEHARNHPALTDSQTGLANGLHFDLVYNYLFNAGSRGLPFTVLLLSAGAGDGSDAETFRKIGEGIAEATRSSDLVSHLSSGRYAVLLLGSNLQGSRVAADRIESTLTPISPGPISFGMAAYQTSYTEAQDLLKDADAALMAAEAAGGGIEFG